jgi:hypothetical protein
MDESGNDDRPTSSVRSRVHSSLFSASSLARLLCAQRVPQEFKNVPIEMLANKQAENNR